MSAIVLANRLVRGLALYERSFCEGPRDIYIVFYQHRLLDNGVTASALFLEGKEPVQPTADSECGIPILALDADGVQVHRET